MHANKAMVLYITEFCGAIDFPALNFQVSIQIPSPHEGLLRLPYSCSGRRLQPLGTTVPHDSDWLWFSLSAEHILGFPSVPVPRPIWVPLHCYSYSLFDT